MLKEEEQDEKIIWLLHDDDGDGDDDCHKRGTLILNYDKKNPETGER